MYRTRHLVNTTEEQLIYREQLRQQQQQQHNHHGKSSLNFQLRKTRYASRNQQNHQHQHRCSSGGGGRTSSHSNKLSRNLIIAGKYRISRRIGSGSFGELYKAINLRNEVEVAVKVESATLKHSQLKREAKIYRILYGSEGIARIYYYGSEGDYNVLVLDLLGPSLEDLFNYCNRAFSLKTTLMLADQILRRVEMLHKHNLLHRDIKPENFLMGVGREFTRVFMIDFGLAKKYYSPNSRQHIAYHEDHNLVGTARYASMRAHYAEQGRRDDLESVGFMLLYLHRGNLPWQGVKAATRKQKYEKIAETKATIALNTLCAGVPFAFSTYIIYCRALAFTATPDYAYVRNLFRQLFMLENLTFDYLFDWVVIKRMERQRRTYEQRYRLQRQQRQKRLHRELNQTFQICEICQQPQTSSSLTRGCFCHQQSELYT